MDDEIPLLKDKLEKPVQQKETKTTRWKQPKTVQYKSCEISVLKRGIISHLVCILVWSSGWG